MTSKTIRLFMAKFNKTNLIVAAIILALTGGIYTGRSVLAGGGGDPCYDGIPNAYFNLSPGNKAIGTLNVTLDGNGSVACDTPIVDYQWDLGDGTTASGTNVTHEYGIGEFSPSLTITDEAGLTNTFTYYTPVIVKADNQDPVLTGESLEILQGENTVINISANGSDPDGDDIANGYFLAGESENGYSLNTDKGYVYGSSGTGEFTYYADDGASGADSFEVGVRDGFGGVGTATVSVNILARINAVKDSATTVENQTVTIDILANDYSYNDEPYEIYWYQISNEGSVRLNEDQTFTFTPNRGFVGTARFEYGIKSSVPNTWRVSTTYVNIEVLPAPNQAPNAADDNLIVSEDTSGNVNVVNNDSDPDGDSFTAALVSGPQNGNATLSPGGTLTYTPNANYFGADSVSYHLTDSEGNVSQAATVTIVVNSVNDLPVATDDSASTSEDSSVTFNVLGNDSDLEDGSDLTVTITSSPSSGSAEVNSDGSIAYMPNANFHGSDMLSYRVSDSDGGSAEAEVSISVSSVNDDPTATFSYLVNNGGWVTFNAGNSLDLDGQIVSYEWNFGNGQTAITTSHTTSHKYKGKGAFNVTLTVTDNEGATATYSQTVSI